MPWQKSANPGVSPKMNGNNLYLGIDTSNYTTSAAITNDGREIIANIKRPLPVAEGACGLRQSDALFAHVKNLPYVMDEVKKVLDGRIPSAVGVSSRPRNVDGSYMPCFLAGVAVAKSVSATCGVPLYEFSHQCGHMMSAVVSSGAYGLLDGEPFLAYHVSGGTTEQLLVRKHDGGFLTEKTGGTLDLNAGQVIDRVGVMLGLRFPCGAELERLALAYEGKIPLGVSVRGTYANLSGLENTATKIYRDTSDREYTAAYVFEYIAKTILKMTDNYFAENGKIPLLFSGGVMSNSIIKSKILAKYHDAYFAAPQLSCDNAVGISVLAASEYGK